MLRSATSPCSPAYITAPSVPLKSSLFSIKQKTTASVLAINNPANYKDILIKNYHAYTPTSRTSLMS